MAHPPLPRRRAGDRRQRRRYPGDARRGAREARAEDRVPRALGRPQRAHGAVQGDDHVSYRDEVVELLQGLLRLDTVNPPGNETRAAELLRDYLARNGVESTARREGAGAREPRRPSSGRRRPDARADRAHRHRRRRRGGVGARPVVGRPRRRRGVGPGRARHEGPRRRGCRRVRVTCPRGAPAAWRRRARAHGGRGGRTSTSGSPGSCGSTRISSAATSRSTRAVASDACSAGKVFYLCGVGREDELRVPRARARSQRPCLGTVDRRQRARQGGPVHRCARPLRAAASAPSRGARVPRGRPRRSAAARGRARSRPRAASARGRARGAAALADALADDDRGLTAAKRDPGPLHDHRRLQAAPGADAGVDRAAAPRRARATAPGSWSGSGRITPAARRRRSTRRSGARWRTGLPRPSRVLGSRRSSAPASRTATGCASAFGTVAYGFFPLKAMDVELASRLVHSANERIAVDDLELGVDLFRDVVAGLAAEEPAPA